MSSGPPARRPLPSRGGRGGAPSPGAPSLPPKAGTPAKPQRGTPPGRGRGRGRGLPGSPGGGAPVIPPKAGTEAPMPDLPTIPPKIAPKKPMSTPAKRIAMPSPKLPSVSSRTDVTHSNNSSPNKPSKPPPMKMKPEQSGASPGQSGALPGPPPVAQRRALPPVQPRNLPGIPQNLEKPAISPGGVPTITRKATISTQQNPMSAKAAPAEGTPEAIASAKRLAIAKEIISTESTYQRALDVLVNHYQKPITAAAESVLLPLILKDDVTAVFSNTSHILPISKTLLTSVEQRVDAWTADTLIGDIFVKMAPFFRIYNKYQNNYEKAVETLTKLQKDETFNTFVDTIDAVVKAEVKDEKATVKLESLIIMPIQRIPRIILLLGELQRKTPDTHPDKDILGKAIEALDEVMNYLDKDITSEEFREKFLSMGTKFKGGKDLIKAHRVLIDEVNIFLKDKTGKEPPTGIKSKIMQQPKLRIWLFNDVLVHLKSNKSKKKTNVASTEYTWPLQLVWLKDEPDDPLDVKMPYSFMLVGPRKFYYLKFAEESEKKTWFAKIQKQIKANLTEENSDETDEQKRYCYYKFAGKYDAEYEGWWLFGRLHGQGSFKIMSNVYKGDFEYDRKAGTGTFSSVSGEVYHGDWKEDRPNGYGQLLYTNKDRYEGEWENGLRHGKGIHYYANGDCYDGEWNFGVQSGSGKYTTTTGFIYTGSWSTGKIHGAGVLIAPNGRKYNGEFKNGLKHGEGFMDYNNGETYLGQWSMDKPNGFGIFTSCVDGTYSGTFVNGLKDGTGKIVYLNGDWYEGGFKKGQFHDKGSMTCSSGGLERYDGKWEAGKFCGKGICNIRGIGKLEGEFKDDKPHGTGTFSSKGGTFFDGKWSEGRREGKATICTATERYSSACTKGMMGKREASFLVTPDVPALHLEM